MFYHLRWDKAVLAVLWLVFSIWTLRKLSSLGPEERVERKFGVNQFGLFSWAGTTVAGVMLMQSSPGASLWKDAAYMGFVMFPICAWGGYLWGKAMSAMLNR
jgi:hypothetical protein